MILATNSDVNAVSQCASKNKEKIEKLHAFDLSYFFGKTFFFFFAFKNMKYVYFSTNIV